MNSVDFVLDASALLALLHREQGSDVVAEAILEGSAISTVNLAEIVSKQVDISMPAETTITLVQLTGVRIMEFDTESAALAGSLRDATKSLGLSLGDRACLALGLKYNCSVLTADRAWNQLDIGIDIVQIR